MDKQQAEKRIKELRKKVEYHAKKYYDEDKPEISDFEYDMMMLELRTLESQYPEFITKTSLTQKVGGTVKEGFKKVTHEVPLQSLQDVFNFEEIEAFEERVKKQAAENGSRRRCNRKFENNKNNSTRIARKNRYYSKRRSFYFKKRI